MFAHFQHCGHEPEVDLLMVEVDITHCRFRLVYNFMHKPALDSERRKYSEK